MINLMKYMMQSTDGEKLFNLYQDTAYENLPQQYVKSDFRDLETYLRTKRKSEKRNKFILKVYSSAFVIFVLLPVVHNVLDINNTLSDLVKMNVVTDDIRCNYAKKAQNKEYFKFWWKAFFEKTIKFFTKLGEYP